MLLKEIYDNSAYLMDEDMTESQAVAVANGGIAVINTKASTNLPFFTTDNYQKDPYDAVKNSWQLRLLEPYITWSMYSNDGVSDNSVLNFHYNRFTSAIEDFKNLGLGDIKTEDEDGNPTGYEGSSKKSALIKNNKAINPFRGWW